MRNESGEEKREWMNAPPGSWIIRSGRQYDILYDRVFRELWEIVP
jgi:hypothetical protein